MVTLNYIQGTATFREENAVGPLFIGMTVNLDTSVTLGQQPISGTVTAVEKISRNEFNVTVA